MSWQAIGSIPAAKDGVGIAGALINREGCLVLTLSDGATKELGVVAGKDVDPEHVAKLVADEVARIPRPIDGKDGKDGLGFDDFEEEFDGERTITRRYRSGDRVKEFKHTFPMMIYRGVFEPGKTYHRGDTTTWGGSLWHCDQTTTTKPGEHAAGTKDWTLCAKRGAEGKQGQKGEQGIEGLRGPQGPQGPRGH